MEIKETERLIKNTIKKEGDSFDWKDSVTGYNCCMIRHPSLGHLCGYVEIPESHPLYNKTDIIDAEYVGPANNIMVHGGISFSDKMEFVDNGRPLPNNREGFWIGFDCAHLGDLVPSTFFRCGFMFGTETYKSKQFIKKECTKLAKQLKDIEMEQFKIQTLAEQLKELD